MCAGTNVPIRFCNLAFLPSKPQIESRSDFLPHKPNATAYWESYGRPSLHPQRNKVGVPNGSSMVDAGFSSVPKIGDGSPDVLATFSSSLG